MTPPVCPVGERDRKSGDLIVAPRRKPRLKQFVSRFFIFPLTRKISSFPFFLFGFYFSSSYFIVSYSCLSVLSCGRRSTLGDGRRTSESQTEIFISSACFFSLLLFITLEQNVQFVTAAAEQTFPCLQLGATARLLV